MPRFAATSPNERPRTPRLAAAATTPSSWIPKYTTSAPNSGSYDGRAASMPHVPIVVAVHASGAVDDAVAHLQPAASGFAGGELHDGAPLTCTCRPPRPHVLRDLFHAVLAVEEDDVDRKAHERRVHRRRRPQEQPFVGRQLLASEQ